MREMTFVLSNKIFDLRTGKSENFTLLFDVYQISSISKVYLIHLEIPISYSERKVKREYIISTRSKDS